MKRGRERERERERGAVRERSKAALSVVSIGRWIDRWVGCPRLKKKDRWATCHKNLTTTTTPTTLFLVVVDLVVLVLVVFVMDDGMDQQPIVQGWKRIKLTCSCIEKLTPSPAISVPDSVAQWQRISLVMKRSAVRSRPLSRRVHGELSEERFFLQNHKMDG